MHAGRICKTFYVANNFLVRLKTRNNKNWLLICQFDGSAENQYYAMMQRIEEALDAVLPVATNSMFNGVQGSESGEVKVKQSVNNLQQPEIRAS